MDDNGNLFAWDNIVTALKNEYQQANTLVRLFASENESPWDIKDISINLAYVVKSQNSQEVSWQDMYVNSIDSLPGTRIPTTLNQLFDNQSSDGARRVWIVGAAGCGKSTIVQRIANDWATQSPERPFELPNAKFSFEMVIWVRLRHLSKTLTQYRYQGDLIKNKRTKKVAYDQTFGLYLLQNLPSLSEEIYPEDIADALKQYQNKCLFILDGYDEIASLENQEDNNLVMEMFKSLIHFPNVMVTSRPSYAVPTIVQFDKVELVGFLPVDCQKYIDHHFSGLQSELAQFGHNRLSELLENNPKIQGVVHIPVNLEILCRLLSGGSSDSDTLIDLTRITQTKLYFEMVQYLLMRSQKDNLVLQSAAAAVNQFESEGLLVLGKLALQGLISRRMSFPHEEVKHLMAEANLTDLSAIHSLIQLGFLRGFTWTENRKNFVGEGEFLHLSLQEFFASWFLVYAHQKNLNVQTYGEAQQSCGLFELLGQVNFKFSHSFSMVWPFVSGLLSLFKLESTLNQFADKLINQSPYDLYGVEIYKLLIRCAEETLPGNLPPAWEESLRVLFDVPEEKYIRFPMFSVLSGSSYVLQHFQINMDMIIMRSAFEINMHVIDKSTMPLDTQRDLSARVNTGSVFNYHLLYTPYKPHEQLDRVALARIQAKEELALCKDILDNLVNLPPAARPDYLISKIRECFQNFNPYPSPIYTPETELGLVRMKMLPLQYFPKDLLFNLILCVESHTARIAALAYTRISKFRYETQHFKKTLIPMLERLLSTGNPLDRHIAIICFHRLNGDKIPVHSQSLVNYMIEILKTNQGAQEREFCIYMLLYYPKNMISDREDLLPLLLPPYTNFKDPGSCILEVLQQMNLSLLSADGFRHLIPVLDPAFYNSRNRNSLLVSSKVVASIGKSHSAIFPELFYTIVSKYLVSLTESDMEGESVKNNLLQILGIISEELFPADALERNYHKKGEIIWKFIYLHLFKKNRLPPALRERVIEDFLQLCVSNPTRAFECMNHWNLPRTDPRLIKQLGVLLSSESFSPSYNVVVKDWFPALSGGSVDLLTNLPPEFWEALAPLPEIILKRALLEGEILQREKILQLAIVLFENLVKASEKDLNQDTKQFINQVLQGFKSACESDSAVQAMLVDNWPHCNLLKMSSLKMIIFCGIQNLFLQQHSKLLGESGPRSEFQMLYLLSPSDAHKKFCGENSKKEILISDLLKALVVSMTNQETCPTAYVSKVGVFEYQLSFPAQETFVTYPFNFPVSTIRLLLEIFNWRRTQESNLPEVDFTRVVPPISAELAPPFSTHKAFAQYFLESSNDRGKLKDLALDYVQSVSRVDEITSLASWFECNDTDIHQALTKRIQSTLSVADQANVPTSDAHKIQILGEILNQMLEEQSLVGILDSTDSEITLLRANSLLDELFAAGVALDSIYRTKLKDNVRDLLYSNVKLFDTFKGKFVFLDQNFDWVIHKFLSNFESLRRHGSREETHLYGLRKTRKNIIDLILKSSR